MSGRIRDRWTAVWFEPRSVRMLVAARTCLGLLSLIWLVSLAPDLTDFYGTDGLIGARRWSEYQVSLLRFSRSEPTLWLLWGASLVGALTLVVGRGVRVGAPVVAYGLMSFIAVSRLTVNGGDRMLRNMLVLFALYAIFTPSWLLDVHLLGDHESDAGVDGVDGDGVDGDELSRSAPGRYPVGPVWGLRLIQLQFMLTYPFGVLGKIQGERWLDGTASLLAMGLVRLRRFPVPGAITDSLLVGNVLTWVTLGLEAALPVLLISRRTRKFAIAAGVAMHLSFDYAMRLGLFSWVMYVGYLTFVSDADWERVLRRLRTMSARSPFGHGPVASAPATAEQ